MIPYTKLSSQGNDFILVELKDLQKPIPREKIIQYSDRNNIGCDQFFVINTFDHNNVVCNVYNSDGSEACQCGNGLRATMLFLNKKYGVTYSNLEVCGKKYMSSINDNKISISMGTSQTISLPNNLSSIFEIRKDGIGYQLFSEQMMMEFSFVPLSIGNQHCVVFLGDTNMPQDMICSIIDSIFYDKMNIGFIQNKLSEFMKNTDMLIRLTVRERGAGYTKSCGSGATAAAICLFRLYEINNENKIPSSKIRILQEGGELVVEKKYNPDDFILIGPSSIISNGILDE